MRVLFVGLRWDYKDPSKGDSFEYWNFWDVLRSLEGVEAELFPFDEIESAVGREQMKRSLVQRVDEWEPDLVFFFFFSDEFSTDVVAEITKKTTTINWFADDQWRFEIYSRFWAPHLTWVATTDRVAQEKYLALGFDNVIRTQWGCNHHIYRPVGVDRDLDVSFIGQPHGDRPGVVAGLRSAGFQVSTWGTGWAAGRLSQEQMIEVFCRSKINLNLSNASRGLGFRELAALFVRRKGKVFVPRSPRETRKNFAEFMAKRRDQIKGRNFEIPGCKTFLLTTDVPELDEYFVYGNEIETFGELDDLVEKIRHYLNSPDEREKIAQRGYERTMRDHTYDARFRSLFERMGLST